MPSVLIQLAIRGGVMKELGLRVVRGVADRQVKQARCFDEVKE